MTAATAWLDLTSAWSLFGLNRFWGCKRNMYYAVLTAVNGKTCIDFINC